MLHAPYIDSILPASAGNTIIIPFEHHQTVSKDMYTSLSLKIVEPLNNDAYIGTYFTTVIQNSSAVFNISNLLPGHYYKVYLAYMFIEDAELKTGYYSTAGIMKYTAAPDITIDLTNDFLANIEYKVPSEDLEEILYSYSFALYKGSVTPENLVASSETKIINYGQLSASDVITDSYQFPYQFSLETTTYLLTVSCTTINNYIPTVTPIDKTFVFSATDLFKIRLNESLQNTTNENAFIKVSCYEAGRIDRLQVYVQHISLATGGIEYQLYAENEMVDKTQGDNGYYYTVNDWSRPGGFGASDFTNFTLIRRHTLTGETIILHSSNTYDYTNYNEYYDFSIEHGAWYQYIYCFTINTRNDTHITYYSASPVIQSSFEDLFLYDSTHQLKLAFNPKIDSFKIVKPTQKIEPLGSKYPVLVSNGSLCYKEFTIKGLISYLLDAEGLFVNGINDQEYGGIKQIFAKMYADVDSEFRSQTHAAKFTMEYAAPSTNLTAQNLYLDRHFRNAVLDWLNNGQPKVLKSPTEGNMIIRLMNITMSPEDKLGRAIYTITAQAVEIYPYNEQTLKNLSLLTYQKR